MAQPLRKIVPLLEAARIPRSIGGHIVYPDDMGPYTRRVPYDEEDATKHVINHHHNVMFLRAVSKAPKDTHEKMRAEKEIGMAEKKIDRWKKHPNYDHKRASDEINKINKSWESSQARSEPAKQASRLIRKEDKK